MEFYAVTLKGFCEEELQTIIFTRKTVWPVTVTLYNKNWLAQRNLLFYTQSS